MDQVPKILKPMVTEWTKGEGFIVSFKVILSLIHCLFILNFNLQLETDQQLLIPKARAALERYGHQVVIGNELHRRKYEVVFISRKDLLNLAHGTEAPSHDVDMFSETWLRIPVPAPSSNPATNPVREIEEDIVMELSRRHEHWITETH